MADLGVLGIAMPEAYGGTGLGVTEARWSCTRWRARPGAERGASAIHINIFGRTRWWCSAPRSSAANGCRPSSAASRRPASASPSPTPGSTPPRSRPRADRDGDDYRVFGKKIWTTTAQEADKILLLTRTTPKEECRKRTDGLTLFYTDLDRRHVDVRVIPKMGRAAVDSNEVFIDGLPVPVGHRIGDEGRGFEYLLHSLNPERILVGVEAVGLGRNALDRAAKYARERIVFGRPIGQNQSIQHPLAESWMQLEAAFLMALAADLYDRGEPCGPWANAAKYPAPKPASRPAPAP